MNQTRTFLLIAWLFVAFLLFQQWQSPLLNPEVSTAQAPTAPTTAANPAPVAGTSLPSLPAQASAAAPSLPAIAAAGTGQTVTIESDVHKLSIDLNGVSIVRAELKGYPLEKKSGSPNVVLLDDKGEDFYVAQSGWLTQSGQSAPTHEARFRTRDGETAYRMADDQDTLVVPFVWEDPSGVKLTKSLVLHRGRFDIGVRQEIENRWYAGTRSGVRSPGYRIAQDQPLFAD